MNFSQPEDRCSGRVIIDNRAVLIEGRFERDVRVDNGTMHFLAAAPADHRESFTGSGLPFANEDQAFADTPNRGSVDFKTGVAEYGAFKLACFLPNSYYADFSGALVGPEVLLIFSSSGKERVVRIRLPDAIPYRSLTYPALRQSPSFYESGWRMPVRTQEQVLRDAGYPCKNKEDPHFWGLKPPM